MFACQRPARLSSRALVVLAAVGLRTSLSVDARTSLAEVSGSPLETRWSVADELLKRERLRESGDLSD